MLRRAVRVRSLQLVTKICLHKTILNFHLPVTEGSVILLFLSFSLEELKFKSLVTAPSFNAVSAFSSLNSEPVWDLPVGNMLDDLQSNKLINIFTYKHLCNIITLKML